MKLNKNIYSVLSFTIVVLSLIIAVNAIFSGSVFTAGESTADTAMDSRINPNFSEKALLTNGIELTTDEPTEPEKRKPSLKTKRTKKK